MQMPLALAVSEAAECAPRADRRRAALIHAGTAAGWLSAQGRYRAPRGGASPSAAVRAVPWESSEYPEGFRSLETPPPVVFLRGGGQVVPPMERCVALVGARRCTEEGRWIAHDLAAGLAREGVTVVSGLAFGIDAAAHSGALSVGGVTLAVLPSDVDRPAPRRNTGLAEEIAAGPGMLLSERPPGASVRPSSFPRRNRLVAASAAVVVVVEAALQSGTLSTVEWALKLGRTVGAVPGSPLSGASAGSNALLSAGAAVVTGVDDVLRLLGRWVPPGAPMEDDEARTVLRGVPRGVAPAEEWIDASGLAPRRARSALLRLLAGGALRRIGQGRVARVL